MCIDNNVGAILLFSTIGDWMALFICPAFQIEKETEEMDYEKVKKYMSFFKEDVIVFINLECCEKEIFYGTIGEIPEHVAEMHVVAMGLDTESDEPVIVFLVMEKESGGYADKESNY
uniref:hypothetical protein n=1 Tax=Acetatifactor sp. TaxID=1872090 RepID=UPI0040562BC7